MSAQAMTLTQANFEQEVLEATGPVLVDFWAPWCGPCRMVGPVVEALAEEYAGRAKVGKLNVDDEAPVAAQYQILSIPSLLLFKGGQPVDRVVGAAPRDQLAAMLDKHLEP